MSDSIGWLFEESSSLGMTLTTMQQHLDSTVLLKLFLEKEFKIVLMHCVCISNNVQSVSINIKVRKLTGQKQKNF